MDTSSSINKWSIISVISLVLSFLSLFYLSFWGYYLQIPLAIIAGFTGITSLEQIKTNLQKGRMLSIISTTVASCYFIYILWVFFSADSNTIKSNILASPMVSFSLLGLAGCFFISRKYLVGAVFVILSIIAFGWSFSNNFVGG